MFYFLAVWAGGAFYLLLFGRGRVLLFAVWAVGVFYFFCCLGGGACFIVFRLGGCVCVFLLFGQGREFNHLPACLAGLTGA